MHLAEFEQTTSKALMYHNLKTFGLMFPFFILLLQKMGKGMQDGTGFTYLEGELKILTFHS
jgi:hypothetical protein